ncbi:energy transducer TonB [Flavilitoribacter nigricans]|uniref:TonB C-terminal domain-containing protein n=1 Tax=Flavilitoribacter nigricans (strain ATCC 23147 / DSM 23189 / NBRC 102662 / NCIMB 1420 / SS-2) TaxID=1122177 RepID=A0A2D0NKD2_FLAN2|nr:hypothetical protein [Flavilitoribacter nigricans]PHN08669.1 hypothetical protein CRP01_01795 [Flavilitoribacter nigricans DSM 23189 = NBRC 102662]
MKKRMVIVGTLFCFIGLTAFSFINRKHSATVPGPVLPLSEMLLPTSPTDVDFLYEVDNRFQATITKEELENARSIIDILSPNHRNSGASKIVFSTFQELPRQQPIVESYHNIAVSTFGGLYQKQIRARGTDDHLNVDQIQLLRSLDYGSSFYISGHTLRKDKFRKELVKDTLIQYMSVVPQQAAVYSAGKPALLKYLKENSTATVAIARRDRLQPGKIGFTVTKDGKIGQVRLNYPSGYNAIDEKMLQLIRDMPGSWEPAINARGEKVEQELVFFFGLIGC